MAIDRNRGGSLGRVRQRVRQRASQRAALNQPDLTQHLQSSEPEPLAKPPDRTDWPVIHSTHPDWWQVHRVVQVKPGLLDFELIAQCQTEDEAFRVSTQQQHQCRITKWNDKRQPYFSFRPPKVCAQTNVDVTDERGDR